MQLVCAKIVTINVKYNSGGYYHYKSYHTKGILQIMSVKKYSAINNRRNIAANISFSFALTMYLSSFMLLHGHYTT
jgi:hypothetical protein